MNYKNNLGYVIITILSIVVGILYGYFYATSIIEAITAILWSAFALALFATIILVGIILLGKKCQTNNCLWQNGLFLLFGITGTLIFSEVTLAITINTTLIAILVGITAFFTTFTIFSLTKFIACLIKASCCCKE